MAVKMQDIDRAKLLADAVKAIPSVRAGLKEKTQRDCPMRLEVEAYEDEGDGGVGHGSVLLPVEYANEILHLIEAKLADDLSALGVTS